MILKSVPMATLLEESLDSKNVRAVRELRAHLIEYPPTTNEKTEAQRNWVTCPCQDCIADQYCFRTRIQVPCPFWSIKLPHYFEKVTLLHIISRIANIFNFGEKIC